MNWYCDLTDGVDQCKIDLEWSMPAAETRYQCWPTGHGAMLDNGKAGKDEACLLYTSEHGNERQKRQQRENPTDEG